MYIFILIFEESGIKMNSINENDFKKITGGWWQGANQTYFLNEKEIGILKNNNYKVDYYLPGWAHGVETGCTAGKTINKANNNYNNVFCNYCVNNSKNHPATYEEIKQILKEPQKI